MMRRYWWNLGSFGMIFMMIFQIIFWTAIVRGIIALVQSSWEPKKYIWDNEALHILKKKYANWDISKKEFLEKKKDLLT